MRVGVTRSRRTRPIRVRARGDGNVSDGAPKIYRDVLPRGTALNGFTIDAVLGRGGFGTTYQASDPLGQTFAIKEYFPRQFAVRDGLTVLPGSEEDRESFEDCRARFLTEAKLLAALARNKAGAGIVKVVTFFEANGTGYIVMEHLHGENLEAELRREPNGLPAERIGTLLREILGSLAEVHAAGLMHRDIKPANIFIRDDGYPVLIDFGAARAVIREQDSRYTSLYSGGYAPFEQIAGLRQGPYSDLYAWGRSAIAASAAN